MAEVRLYGYVGDPVEGFTARTFAESMAGIDKADDLDIYINSGGGSVWDGLTAYQELVARSGHNRIIVQGIAASIASVIAMAGDEIIMGQSSRLMIHDPMGPSAIAFGTSKDLREAADETLKIAGILDRLTQQTADVYAARTGNTRQQVLDWMSAETYFDAAEAREHGFATEVTSNKTMVASSVLTPRSEAMTADELQRLAGIELQIRQPRSRIDHGPGRLRMAQARQRLMETS